MHILHLTTNNKKIITLLRDGEASKRDLMEKSGLSWATIVKSINQLTEARIVECNGELESGKRGKNANTYCLNPRFPLVIGIDVGYKETRTVVTNVSGEILCDFFRPTPYRINMERALSFLSELITLVFEKVPSLGEAIIGVGIGKPGIGFPSTNRKDNIKETSAVQETLSKKFNVPVRIDINTKAYAIFERWYGNMRDYNDFIFVQLRSGVGTGIISNGQLYSGTNGLSGEIGHIKVVNNGLPCRCGNSGCMETLVNQYYLFEQYRKYILGPSSSSEIITDDNDEALKKGLADLCTRAKEGNETACSIVKTAAAYLGLCLAYAISILDITQIVLSGFLGEDGDVFVPYLNDTIEKNISNEISFSVQYLPFDKDGHVFGAAMLIYKDFLVDI
jgi:predicted NBD/HSP70 family sugar kinase